jgi:hypothetical protein
VRIGLHAVAGSVHGSANSGMLLSANVLQVLHLHARRHIRAVAAWLNCSARM